MGKDLDNSEGKHPRDSISRTAGGGNVSKINAIKRLDLIPKIPTRSACPSDAVTPKISCVRRTEKNKKNQYIFNSCCMYGMIIKYADGTVQDFGDHAEVNRFITAVEAHNIWHEDILINPISHVNIYSYKI